MDKLKPCPFCGGKPAIVEDGYKAIAVHCFNCGADITAETSEKARAAWNRRPAPENNPLTLDQLRQMDGEPVWWWNKSHAPVCTVCIARFNQVSFVDFDYSHEDSTGIIKYERWLKWGFKPYARKPEEEEQL